jgi:uncharacterized protein (TIGR02118 family)
VPKDHPLDEDAATVKAIVALRREHGLPVAEFREALAGTVGIARGVPGVQRYVRSVTTEGGYRKGDPVYDAVDELWFRDEDAARHALASDVYAGLHSRLRIDPASGGAFLVADHVIKHGEVQDGGLKNFEFVTRRPDLSREEFRRYWREHHGPLAAGIEVMRGYVQSHTLDSEYDRGAPMWDGAAITWFDDIEAMRASSRDPVYTATREDEENFLGAPLALPFIITTEQVLFGSPR